MQDIRQEVELALTRRQLFSRAARFGLGIPALSSLLSGATNAPASASHFPAKARRVIFLHQSGGPSQMDLFDPKPAMKAMFGSELPGTVRMGQRITGMTSGQSALPVAPSVFQFAQHGKSGAWMSELLPHTANVVDDLTIIKSLHTDAINHDPAITFIQTGSQQPGRPSLGTWVTYGLGSENKNLPAFVVLLSTSNTPINDQPLFSRLWGSGFLPSNYQGVRFRSGAEPVLYLKDPDGLDRSSRRLMLDGLEQLNRMRHEAYADPEIETRIAQFEMAYRMQSSVPDLMDLWNEPESTFKLYGEEARKPGTYAANCLLARRLAERDVRFVQLYHRGWDQHNELPRHIAMQCRGTDQASAALVTDLKQRGLLEDTLVVWGGEFGRTIYCQGKLTETSYGRDHHPRNFAWWLAGGGMKAGLSYGETDDFSYNITKDPVHVHDMQATILHLLGMDHTRLTYKFQGRWFRLTDVHGNVTRQLLA
ncbi:MAG: DUF1501 domain-containing protein [Acidobacteria bacterium]|nr:DUF1501 domain-containing protein [Acidobacteriota bacterium]